MTTGSPGLVLAAHGTRDPGGPAVFTRLAELVRRQMSGARVCVGYVDVIGPTLAEALAEAHDPGHGAVVVPVFLGSGYHVDVDIPGIVAAHGGRVDVTPPLGPAAEVVRAVAQRYTTATVVPGRPSGDRPRGPGGPDAVVLAAAGSGSHLSREQTRTAAQALSRLLERPVTVGFASAVTPTVADAVRLARSDDPDTTVGIATYLLGPGVFHDRLREAGADLVAPPLGAHPELVDLVVRRYRECLATRQPGLADRSV